MGEVSVGEVSEDEVWVELVRVENEALVISYPGYKTKCHEGYTHAKGGGEREGGKPSID